MHQKCFQCNSFLGGIVLTTIQCETCQKHYHLHCFELDTSEDGEEEEQEEEKEIQVKSGTNIDKPYCILIRIQGLAKSTEILVNFIK